MSEKRGIHLDWADVMRAVLICCLVYGHGSDGVGHSIIYLFHMPCFLILSGYLSSDDRFSTEFLKRKASQLLIPYVVYELATELLFYKTPFSRAVIYTLYGSGRIRGGVLWYLPSFFLTIIVFSIIKDLLPHKKLVAALAFMLCLATVESNYCRLSFAPWNFDVVLIMLFYYGVGYLIRYSILNDRQNDGKLVLIAVIVVLVTIACTLRNNETYLFDMKKVEYKDILANVLYPIAFYVTVRAFSLLISKNQMLLRLFSFIGNNTLSIMFLHIPVNAYINARMHYGKVGYLLVGVAVPLIWKLIIKKGASAFQNKHVQAFVGLL